MTITAIILILLVIAIYVGGLIYARRTTLTWPKAIIWPILLAIALFVIFKDRINLGQ